MMKGFSQRHSGAHPSNPNKFSVCVYISLPTGLVFVKQYSQ